MRTKVNEHFGTLIEAATDDQHVKIGRDRQIISLAQYSDPMVFILHEGIAAVYRSLDHMLIANMQSPMIIGLNAMNKTTPDVYLQARGTIRYELIERDTLMELIDQTGLWKPAAYVTMYISFNFYREFLGMTALSSYDLIKNNLEALMAEPDDIRLKTHACDYIREKTMLSRSNVMKTLRDLKEGGYITLERGILTGIGKLPTKY